MKSAIFYLENRNGTSDRFTSIQDMIVKLGDDSLEIQSIKVFTKNDFAITRIQSDLQSICNLLNSGIMAMNSNANWDNTDNLLPLLEITNNSIKNLEEIKLKLWTKIDFELQGDLS